MLTRAIRTRAHRTTNSKPHTHAMSWERLSFISLLGLGLGLHEVTLLPRMNTASCQSCDPSQLLHFGLSLSVLYSAPGDRTFSSTKHKKQAHAQGNLSGLKMPQDHLRHDSILPWRRQPQGLFEAGGHLAPVKNFLVLLLRDQRKGCNRAGSVVLVGHAQLFSQDTADLLSSHTRCFSAGSGRNARRPKQGRMLFDESRRTEGGSAASCTFLDYIVDIHAGEPHLSRLIEIAHGSGARYIRREFCTRRRKYLLCPRLDKKKTYLERSGPSLLVDADQPQHRR